VLKHRCAYLNGLFSKWVLQDWDALGTRRHHIYSPYLWGKLSVIQISRSILLQQVFQRSKHAV
jgi:lysozyme family protein